MANSSRYRVVGFVGARILENTELLRLQSLARGVNPLGSKVVYDLDQIYYEGAVHNITVSISGLTATFSATDSSQPMAVFVRGRWETLSSGDLSSITLSSSQTNIYLNYALNIVTSDGAGGTLLDASLVDSVSGEATANMGELDLSISATDTSGVALNSATQYEKNTYPIIMFQFTNNGTTLTRVTLDNVKPHALGTLGIAGMVKPTTKTCQGVVVATDDPRMADSRAPSSGSVTDASVRTPIPTGGTNTDGSAVYSIPADAGGISAAKIIWVEATERVSDFLAWVRSQFSGILATLASHINVPLGSSATHPMPTAFQVGAAPLSHVNLPLGVTGSHPAQVSTDSGGFSVIRDPGAPAAAMDPAYAVLMSSVLQSGLLHNGDVFSLASNGAVAYPGGADGDGGQTPTSLGLMTAIATILANHVNKVSHKNPHGLTLNDLVTADGFAFSSSYPGYIKMPASLGGFTIQWGTTPSFDTGPTTVSFPTTFAHACFMVLLQDTYDDGNLNSRIWEIGPRTTTGFTCRNNGTGAAYFVAIGW